MGWKNYKIQTKSISLVFLTLFFNIITANDINESLVKHKDTFNNVALEIWNYAELGYLENKSSSLLAKSLESNGSVSYTHLTLPTVNWV